MQGVCRLPVFEARYLICTGIQYIYIIAVYLHAHSTVFLTEL